MSTIPAQPSLPQYPISDLYLLPNYGDRAAYVAAVGNQAPPFNPALPIKGWADPAPDGQPYNFFDGTSPSTGYVIQLPVPAAAAVAVNLPGVYDYPAYVEAPTGATMRGPYGMVSPVLPNTLCLQTEAQAIANQVAPLYPGESVIVADGSFVGIFQTVYPADEPRRQWILEVGGKSFSWAEAWIAAQNANGVGAPGHWALAPIPGDIVTTPMLQWIQDSPVTVAPPNAITLPVPIRPLLPNEEIELVPPPNPLFGTATWIVVRTDMPQPPTITLAQVQQLVAQYNAQPGVTAIPIPD
jgi:hypothetical protein